MIVYLRRLLDAVLNRDQLEAALELLQHDCVYDDELSSHVRMGMYYLLAKRLVVLEPAAPEDPESFDFSQYKINCWKRRGPRTELERWARREARRYKRNIQVHLGDEGSTQTVEVEDTREWASR